ncbi:hypothetical protein MCOR25_000436 [Pyricularia grisea]|uniref:Uncharacterized protein n=1 Tax=Pyricularia grisea TaxID=148305 RepID=A0A6P8AUT4_PYRGI|nr:uncharacterized protein PgNI_08859 [Pyricularia grisea]KAI6382922.1 hypothetical protein MCOR25_000436 [Pyricularia grisea]TLD05983.1 hypothetical protein PgNI_08859 [Pyricularia grisea]
MTTTVVNPPDLRAIIGPLLLFLPGATFATQPPEGVLPLLSPILRQRVQLLSGSGSDPWIRLLSYDAANTEKLTELARGDRFEPHPSSGEIEVDWDHDVTTRYRRCDEETLQVLVVLSDFGISFRLVYCTGDTQGGGDGWRVGEVNVLERPDPFASFGGEDDISAAEEKFGSARAGSKQTEASVESRTSTTSEKITEPAEEDGGDDDDYWARYDATPARTPAAQLSPAHPSSTQPLNMDGHIRPDADDAYYARYDSVQPAMDNHDPDEEANLADNGISLAPPPLGLARPPGQGERTEETQPGETQGSWTIAGGSEGSRRSAADDGDRAILHPRPASAASSSGSSMVSKLEESAERRAQSEFGVKQHVSRTIRSLFQLSTAAGIDREEFERMVRSELELLQLIDEE